MTQMAGEGVSPLNLLFERSHLKQLKEKHLTSLKEPADLRPRSPPSRVCTWGQSEADSASICRAGAWGGLGRGQLSTSVTLPQPPALAAGAVLRGKEAFPVPPPPNFPTFLASPEERR